MGIVHSLEPPASEFGLVRTRCTCWRQILCTDSITRRCYNLGYRRDWYSADHMFLQDNAGLLLAYLIMPILSLAVQLGWAQLEGARSPMRTLAVVGQRGHDRQRSHGGVRPRKFASCLAVAGKSCHPQSTNGWPVRRQPV